MIRELSTESNVSDLVDYLLEKDVDIHILVPDDYNQMLQIRADGKGAHGRLIRCVKGINMIGYNSAPPEFRNVIVTQTIQDLVKELAKF